MGRILCLTLVFFLPIAIMGDVDIESFIGERNYIISINELPIGEMTVTRAVEGDYLLQEREINIEIVRSGEKVTLTLNEKIKLNSDGSPVSFSYTENSNTGLREISGEIVGNLITLTGSNNGKEIKPTRMKWDNDFILDDMIFMLPIIREDISEITTDVFYPQFVDFIKTRITISETDSGYEVICKDNLSEYKPTIYRTDHLGWLTFVYDSSLGIPLTIKPGSLELANEFDIIETFRVGVFGSDSARRFNLHFNGEISEGLFPDGDFQEVSYISEDTVQVYVHKRRVEKIEGDAYLSSGSPYWTGDERLMKIITSVERENSGGKRALAKALSKWVSKTLVKKDFSQIQGDALSALDYGGGDCSEHTYLLVGLLRTAGIPARGVVGLLRSGDYFYYHMWVEYWDKGWQPLDPTIGTMSVQHIKLINLPPEGGMDIYTLKLLIEALNIKRIEVVD